ncbi:MAG: type VI secretion system ImpA family N-terminal domain-containing protein [Erythrobacter sp.]|nr:type VI secretion system ImpA family N-terminal domain-containing protein [Erythrobacter sp.]
MKSLVQLLLPVSDDAPAGEDMDESLEFDRLRTAFDANFPYDARVTERDPDEPEPDQVDWSELLELIEELSDKTKDLFLGVAYARCGFALQNSEVVAHGLQYTAGLLEEHWDSVFPTPDGDYGPAGRALICEDLAKRGAFPLPFLKLPIMDDGRGRVTAGELIDVGEEGAGAEAYPEVMRMLDQMDDEQKEEISDRLTSFQTSFDEIEAVLKEKSDAEVPDFSTSREFIGKAQSAYAGLTGAETGEDEAAGEGAGSISAAGAGEGGPSIGGAVRSRDDVIKALNAVEQYYERAEPGHPVKVAVARLRGWVTKDFMEILEDIVPNSVDDAKNVLLERDDME